MTENGRARVRNTATVALHRGTRRNPHFSENAVVYDDELASLSWQGRIEILNARVRHASVLLMAKVRSLEAPGIIEHDDQEMRAQ